MRTIIYVHPYQESFCNAIFNQIKRKDDKVIDLYKEKFNPVYSEKELSGYSEGEVFDSQVIEYQKTLKKTNKLIIVTPIWWNNIPGILKGFFDKVFSKNFAYEDGKLGVKGKLQNIENATIITTSNSPVFYLKINGINRNIKMTLKQIGIKNIYFKQFGKIKTSSKRQRDSFLKRIS